MGSSRDPHHMLFGSFASDDLDSLPPAISIPVKKRPSKLSSSSSLTSSSSSISPSSQPVTPPAQPAGSSDLSSSNDNVHSVLPPSSPHDHVPPSVSPHGHEHQLIYNSSPYDPHMTYIPYNSIPPYMPYNPYMPHHMPPHMSHMQPMHLQHIPYGMPQQRLVSPTHSHPHHAHPLPHPNHSHPHPHQPIPLSASSPSFTPAHLHHSAHAPQYPARTQQYEYPGQPQPPQPQPQPQIPQLQSISHPQQAQEQAQPGNPEQLPPKEEVAAQPVQQPQTESTREITQQSTQESAQQQPTQESAPQTQDQKSQPITSNSQTKPESAAAKQPSKKKRGKHAHKQSQQQTQSQTQTQTQTQQPQAEQQSQQVQAQTQAQQVQTQEQPLQQAQPQQPTQPEGPAQPLQTPEQSPQHDQKVEEQLPQEQKSEQENTEASKPVKNWASLFASKAPASAPAPPPNTQQAPAKTTDTHKPKQNGHPTSNGKTPSADPNKPNVAASLVPMSAKLFQDLNKLSITPVPQTLPMLQSRGLKNPTNTCFLNVILQSLIHCPPFAHTLSKLGSVDLPASQMPVTDKFARLYKEFLPNSRPVASNTTAQVTVIGPANNGNSADHKQLVQTGKNNNNNFSQSAPPLLPELFFDLLFPFSERTGIPYKDGDKVNQQDAQEFLTYILDLMHEEFLQYHKSKEAKASEKSEEWEEVGKKNKSSIVLTADTYVQSVISHTFGGKQRSSVRKQSQGSKPSVTIQPFYCLHLDIDKPHINTLEDALDTYMEPEKLEGYTCDVRGVEVQASKHTSLEALPRVLIIHLKRFAYDMSQPRKLDKFIRFPQKLTIKKTFLSKDTSDDKRLYSLYSVVEHRGKVAVKGHYTCDINIGNLHAKPPAPATPSKSDNKTEKSEKTDKSEKSEWLNFDDHNVSRVSPRDVQNRLAYLLFYVQN